MKKFTKIATLLFAFAAAVFTACEQPEDEVIKNPLDDASIKLALVGADKTSATISIDVEVLKVLAYVVEPTASKGTYTAEEILAKENYITVDRVEGVEDPVNIQQKFTDLEMNTEYTVQVAGRISTSSVWSEVVELKFVTEDRDPSLTATVPEDKLGASGAELVVTTDNISRFAYVMKKYEEGAAAPKIPVIFATGTVVKSVIGDNVVELEGLSPKTEYAVYIAGEIAGKEEFFENVCTVRFTTSDFTEQIRVYDINYRGFKVDLKVDPAVAEAKHVIRWGITDLVMWNNNYFGGLMNNAAGGATVASSLILNDKFFGNYVTESTTFTFNEENGYIYDELGNYTGAPYYDPMVPGQPEVLMFGEYRWGDIEAVLGYGYGTPEQNLGYYVPLFNMDRYEYEWGRRKDTFQEVDEAKYWNKDAFFHKEIVQVQRPEPLPEDALKVEISTSPKDAEMYFTVTDDVDLVSLMVLEDENYKALMPYLNNNEEYLQWFTTSMVGMYAVSSFTFNPRQDDAGNPVTGPRVIKLSELFYDLQREYTYHLFAVGLSGDYNNDGYIDGYKQVYKTTTFQLPPQTKVDPVIEIVPNEEQTTPYIVAFDAKCTAGGPVVDVVYALNGRNEWERAQYTTEEILESNAQYAPYHLFSTGVQMNDFNTTGMTITFQAAPGEELGLALMGINDEGSKTISDIVYNTALPEPLPERVESPYFESLKGEWTATATVVTVNVETNDETEEETRTIERVVRSCDVTIGDITYPETLTEDVYELYEKLVDADRATTDGYYKELCDAIDAKNKNIRDFNRILVHGFNFEAEDVPYYNYASPYDLFTSSTYSGTSISPATDFGPKWYLEVAADGTVTAPFNISYFDPMASWYSDKNGSLYESHLVGYHYVIDETLAQVVPDSDVLVGYFGDGEKLINGQFPVEISEDGNTITVKPLLYSYTTKDKETVNLTLYPTAAINYGGGEFDALEICSEIVLTRKGSGNEAVTPALAPSKYNRKAQSDHSLVYSDVKVKERTNTLSRTNFENIKPASKVTVKKYNTKEEKAAAWHAARKAK